MRPTTIATVIAGVLIALAGVALGVWALVDRDGGKLWFYWIAPLLALGFGGMLIMLAAQYWLRVGRLEVKGRPRREGPPT